MNEHAEKIRLPDQSESEKNELPETDLNGPTKKGNHLPVKSDDFESPGMETSKLSEPNMNEPQEETRLSGELDDFQVPGMETSGRPPAKFVADGPEFVRRIRKQNVIPGHEILHLWQGDIGCPPVPINNLITPVSILGGKCTEQIYKVQ